MLNLAIWGASIGLEVVLLARGGFGKLFGKYPIFYGYLSFVLLQDFIRFATYRLYSEEVYNNVYWITEFVALMLGCVLVFEIYRVALSPFPGTARMARSLLILVFAIVLAKIVTSVWSQPHWWAEATFRNIEGLLRGMQALSILALVVVFLFYSVPFGRNLKGILLGYGLFIGVGLVSLTLSGAGVKTREDVWSYVFPASYFCTLAVWVRHLWSYSPNPEPARAVRLEQDYQTIAAATQRRLQGARGYLAKAVRP